MAYTSIDDPAQYFNTVTYTGNGASSHAITGVGFQADWIWIKNRSTAEDHALFDSVRGQSSGVYYKLRSNATNAEDADSQGLSTIGSDGFTVKDNDQVNKNSDSLVSWNWLAGGTAPAITYTVKVVSDSGNKYRFDDFGTSAVTLDLQEGGTYTFDQSDSSNSGHPLRFYTASDKSGGEYTTGVTTTGTAGSSGAKTVITVAASAPTLYYQCSNHAGMGGQANTNSSFGSSNFSGNIQSTVSAGSTQGFSIVSYTGTGSAATVGHGLDSAPKMLLVKNRDSVKDWRVGHDGLTSYAFRLHLNDNSAQTEQSAIFNSTAPTSTVFSIGNNGAVNASSDNIIAYCFAEKQGYSKFGSYTGNGNNDGTFVYTGFKPAFVMIKRIDDLHHWWMWDRKLNPTNLVDQFVYANRNDGQNTDTWGDFLSNGFKLRMTYSGGNSSGGTYTYMAFAESPFVNSKGIPNNAR